MPTLASAKAGASVDADPHHRHHATGRHETFDAREFQLRQQVAFDFPDSELARDTLGDWLGISGQQNATDSAASERLDRVARFRADGVGDSDRAAT